MMNEHQRVRSAGPQETVRAAAPRDISSAAVLMARYCDGEADAFLPLYEILAPVVFARLLTRTGDRVRAEALLQRTFVELHERRSAYVLGADPLPWAMTIAEHLAARRAAGRLPWLARAIDRIGRPSRKASSHPTEIA